MLCCRMCIPKHFGYCPPICYHGNHRLLCSRTSSPIPHPFACSESRRWAHCISSWSGAGIRQAYKGNYSCYVSRISFGHSVSLRRQAVVDMPAIQSAWSNGSCVQLRLARLLLAAGPSLSAHREYSGNAPFHVLLSYLFSHMFSLRATTRVETFGHR